LRKSGGGPLEDEEAARKDLDAVLASPNSDHPNAWNGKGSLITQQALARCRAGEDAAAEFEAAREAFSRAIQLLPDYFTAWRNRGNLHTEWGLWLKREGRDPLPHFELAEQALCEALKLCPWHPKALMQRARARVELARCHEDAGRRDVAQDGYGKALADYEEALAHGPGFAVRIQPLLDDVKSKLAELGR
jgi:tetratricopeptide (TPR) repeat protein